ncbi:MarR family transcriptional regulator [Brachyspira catarrhinii]|uniref:MarR family transcriptional regulator n=1 Tax=Brachyspira catarrhinii TaxID=2528966 RepID=A0ABY2TSC5_9SPIR|nr:MarR family transcriptional regulator [Brachyspira catarrhinii]TKZ35473.1 MarR family transcriptional regulator [Brachyspira catarrhinii]
MDEDFKDYVYRFHKCMQKLDLTFDKYAKTFKLTHTNFKILLNIFFAKNISQKTLCEILTLPKQTVNASITYFYRKGYIKLIENPENRREKIIHFTDKGKKYSESVISKFAEAQFKIIMENRYKDMKIFIDTMEDFVELSSNSIEKIIAELNK